MTTIQASKIGALMVHTEQLEEGMYLYCQEGKELVAAWVDTDHEITLEEAEAHPIFTDYFLWSLWMYTSHMQQYRGMVDPENGRIARIALDERWDEIVKEVEAAYDALCR